MLPALLEALKRDSEGSIGKFWQAGGDGRTGVKRLQTSRTGEEKDDGRAGTMSTVLGSASATKF